MLVSRKCAPSEWQVVTRHFFPENEAGKHTFLLLHFLHYLDILDAMPVIVENRLRFQLLSSCPAQFQILLSWSMPRKRRPSRLAAMPVVLLPANGSRIQAPGLVEARMMRARRASGFWVGCLPCDFPILRWQAAAIHPSSACHHSVFHQLVVVKCGTFFSFLAQITNSVE